MGWLYLFKSKALKIHVFAISSRHSGSSTSHELIKTHFIAHLIYFYTKIGNRVIANAEIYLASKGSNTGNVSIINLPFTTSNDNYQTAHVYNDRVSSPNGDVQGYILTNATTVSLYQSRTDGSNNGNLTGNEMNNTSYLLLLMAYKAA
mgnify:CR=1 FL=1